MKSIATLLALLLVPAGVLRAQDGKGSGAGGGPGTVVVVNELQRTVTVWINGELEGRVEAGARKSFADVAAGRLSLQAGGAGSGGPVAGEDRSLAPGETFTWTLYPLLTWEEERGVGTVVLANELSGDVRVFLGDRPAGTLAPGASRAYPRVAAGELALRAEQADGGPVEEGRLTVEPGRIARWRIDAEPDLPGSAGAAPDNTSTPADVVAGARPSAAPARRLPQLEPAPPPPRQRIEPAPVQAEPATP